MRYEGDPDFRHDPRAIGVLVVNLGSPDAPTAEALRPYLKQFLSDPRVIELPRAQWLPILHLFVLTTRPAKSAKLYEKVWTAEGSPLVAITRRQAEAIGAILAREVPAPVHVAAAMRIGSPSMADALRDLRAKGCRRVLVLPMFPQYSGATTGSVWDGLAETLARWRWVPEVRTVNGWHAEPAFIDALAASIREAWAAVGEPETLLMSFHGLPERYAAAGDPYAEFCRANARLLAAKLGLPDDRWVVAFQSRFGREEWLKPYTDETVRSLARSGVKRLHVVAPAFSADCLETLEELDGLNREFWHEAGGDPAGYHYIPALNDRPDHVRFLADLVKRNLGGWV